MQLDLASEFLQEGEVRIPVLLHLHPRFELKLFIPDTATVDIFVGGYRQIHAKIEPSGANDSI